MKNRIPWILFWAVVMGLVVWNMYSYAGQQHEMEISRKLQAELDVLVKQESTLGENFELMTTAAKSAAKDRLRLVKLLGVCDELDEWPPLKPIFQASFHKRRLSVSISIRLANLKYILRSTGILRRVYRGVVC